MIEAICFLVFLLVILPRIRQRRAERNNPYARPQAGRAYGQPVNPARGAQNAPPQSAAPGYAPQYGAPGSTAAGHSAPQYAASRDMASQHAAPGHAAPQYAAPGHVPPPKTARSLSPQDGADEGKRRAAAKQVLGLLGGIAGTAAAWMFGMGMVAIFGELLTNTAHGVFYGETLAMMAFSGAAAAACVFGARKGFSARSRARNFELYETIIGARRVCPVADIARASGREPRQVVRELGEMVRDGYFPQGFVDEQTACFYADNDAYREANPELARAQDAALRGQAPVPLRPEPALAPGEAGKDDLRALKQQIERVPNEDIRAKALRLCDNAEDIFAWVRLHPECTDDVHRFCSYYLPTATKLLGTYNEVAPHAGESSVAASIESEVSRVLDTMTAAFRELMDHLLQNTAVDMQAEISALETVLAQEGLARDGLTL